MINSAHLNALVTWDKLDSQKLRISELFLVINSGLTALPWFSPPKAFSGVEKQ